MRSDESPPLIEVTDLRRRFPGADAEVLRGIDLAVHVGEVVALRGPSGSGKSTLLNILGCLDRPSAGRYSLLGSDISALSRRDQAWVRLHTIGFVFQSFSLIETYTALENVALPLLYSGIPRAMREARGKAMLERVGLGDRIHYRPRQLSGGQNQRVAIVRACIHNPQLLLADEPTGALDSHHSQEILILLDELHRELNLTIVLVTHDAEVAAHAQRQVFLRDGRIVPAEVQRDPLV